LAAHTQGPPSESIIGYKEHHALNLIDPSNSMTMKDTNNRGFSLEIFNEYKPQVFYYLKF